MNYCFCCFIYLILSILCSFKDPPTQVSSQLWRFCQFLFVTAFIVNTSYRRSVALTARSICVSKEHQGEKKTGALGDHKLLPRNKWIIFSLFLCTSIIKTHHTICSVFLFFVHVGVLANRLFYPVICCLVLISDNILFADGFWGNIVLTFLHFHMWMTMNILCCDSCFFDVQMP